jgi:hypothetical protein
MTETVSPAWLRWPVEVLSIAAVISIAAVLARIELPEPSTRENALAPPAFDSCGSGAYLRGQLFGDLQWSIDWVDTAMRCDGMWRPDEAGMRLIFAPAEAAGGPLLVIGLSGEPDTFQGREVVANLTIVDEGNGRFFNSGAGERCWAQATRVSEQAGDYEVAGRIYCAGALAEVNGPGTVTPGEIEFSGRIPASPE